MEYDIASDELLLRATEYDLGRGSLRITIRVREVIAGVRDGSKFIATPFAVGPSRKEFIGLGDSEFAALQDCLGRIKGVSIDEIFRREDKPTDQDDPRT